MTFLAPLMLAVCLAGDPRSSFSVEGETPVGLDGRGRLTVEVVADDRAGAGRPVPLPVRVVVTASDGSHPDGSGRGTYSDGRFFADGRFSVDVTPGATRVVLSSGPDYETLEDRKSVV